jgi:hypothetical protein
MSDSRPRKPTNWRLPLAPVTEKMLLTLWLCGTGVTVETFFRYLNLWATVPHWEIIQDLLLLARCDFISTSLNAQRNVQYQITPKGRGEAKALLRLAATFHKTLPA